ncbi:hypothetical protein F-LCD7_0272 [Faustovirus]|nr:hypothetical protein F-LCD7_0272 [Faustovirus]
MCSVVKTTDVTTYYDISCGLDTATNADKVNSDIVISDTVISDIVISDTTTALALRGIQVSAKDVLRAWTSLHVALVVEGINYPIVFKAMLKEKPTLLGDYYECDAATPSVYIPQSGRVVRAAVVMVADGELCAISAYRIRFDVVKRKLSEINAKPTAISS